MELLDLHISGFGKFQDQDLSFQDGLNIIYGKNEAGKSTLHTFIRCMLFGLERSRGRASKNDLYTHYKPWDQRSPYGGQLRVKQNGNIYRIERIFQKDQRSFAIIDETRGREVTPDKAFLEELLCGLTETTYTNTVSIGQLKSATDTAMAAELKNYIANMNSTGNMALNITKATACLQNRRKQFERRMHPEAAAEYAALAHEIQDIEQDICAPAYQNQLPAYESLRVQTRRELAKKQGEHEILLQRISTGKQVLAKAHFTDQASIANYRSMAEDIYQNYQKEKSLCENRPRSVLTACLMALAVANAALTIFCYTAGAANPLAAMLGIKAPWLLLGTAAAAMLLSLIVFGMFQNTRRLKKDLAGDSQMLQEIFSRHLGDNSLSEKAKQAFDARMEELACLAERLEKSEECVQEQALKISALQEKEKSCDEMISRQQRTQWELEKKLDHLAACKDRMEALEQTLEENKRLQEETAAISLALDTLKGLSATIRDSFGLHLNKTASEIIRKVTGEAYSSLSVDEDLNVSINTPAKLIPLSQASSGTMDQVYLALRLAAAKLVQSGHDKMPLIFDDSFALYDDERLQAALGWLTETYDSQILVFTCHPREARLLAASQIPYHLISL